MHILFGVYVGEVIEDGVRQEEVFLVLGLVYLFGIQLGLDLWLTPALSTLAYGALALSLHVTVVVTMVSQITVHFLLDTGVSHFHEQGGGVFLGDYCTDYLWSMTQWSLLLWGVVLGVAG